MNMFLLHYLETKKPNFLACIPEQVYAAILESSENNDLFKNYQPYFCRICKTVREKRKQARMESTCYS